MSMLPEDIFEVLNSEKFPENIGRFHYYQFIESEMIRQFQHSHLGIIVNVMFIPKCETIEFVFDTKNDKISGVRTCYVTYETKDSLTKIIQEIIQTYFKREYTVLQRKEKLNKIIK